MGTVRIGRRTTTMILVTVVALSAFFLERNIAVGDTFATQGIDLKIDSQASYNGEPVPASTWELKNLVPGVDHFFNLNDVKPGDHGEATISMHVKKSSAWLCLDFLNLEDHDNSQNEPEALVDSNGLSEGELSSYLEFFAWVDDGDNDFEKGERPLFGTSTQAASVVLNDTTYSIGDSGYGNACRVNESRYIGIYWCAGDLSVDIENALITCDGSGLGNSVQTDSMSVDVRIRAEPEKGNSRFLCGGAHDNDKPHKPPKFSFPPYPWFSWGNHNNSHSGNSNVPYMSGLGGFRDRGNFGVTYSKPHVTELSFENNTPQSRTERAERSSRR